MEGCLDGHSCRSRSIPSLGASFYFVRFVRNCCFLLSHLHHRDAHLSLGRDTRETEDWWTGRGCSAFNSHSGRPLFLFSFLYFPIHRHLFCFSSSSSSPYDHRLNIHLPALGSRTRGGKQEKLTMPTVACDGLTCTQHFPFRSPCKKKRSSKTHRQEYFNSNTKSSFFWNQKGAREKGRQLYKKIKKGKKRN